MSEEINEIFKQWKQFLSWCYENNDKTTEIHRDNLKKVMAYTRQLENIIKEVREYCINRNQYFNEARIEQYTFSREEEYSIENILEILDEVDKEKE